MAEVRSDDCLIQEPGDILDVIANVPTGIVILQKAMLPAAFFDLKTKFAGEMLQKISNYNVRLAVIGDFSEYSSKSLHDFIRESNRSSRTIFVHSIEEAIKKFSS